ncbi:STY0301 family protein [Roseomonas indoligenes]|uniref:Uncharacterized protein n=1 Tax=Roseomonas indoligenes TaxID=2820811 RepID=A0A940N2V1_9PROT|nr:STY0301 family protein [Pararoseomonas indoligenes]MBP0495564.1 hypothetical protein [Pararoseomonas indoligenes]
MRSLFLAVLVLVLLPAAAGAAVLCPAMQDGRPLREVTLFDGPPAELASLVPDQRGRRVTWDVAYIRQAGRAAYLVCGYDRVTRKLEAEVPARARQCGFTSAPGGRIAGAVECQ